MSNPNEFGTNNLPDWLTIARKHGFAFPGASMEAFVTELLEISRRAQPEDYDLSIAADAYMSACDEMERWQKKRSKAGLEIGTEGSLVDGIAWLYAHIEKLEKSAHRSP